MLNLSGAVTAYIICVTAILGLCIGSFLNCFAYRLVHGGSALRGRSKCPGCDNTLSALDLIPVFSWLFLRGRCRYCGKKISPRYVLAELVTALVFVCIVIRYDVTPQAAKFLILASILITAALTDLDGGIIPDRLVIAGIALFFLSLPFAENRLSYLLSGLTGGFSVSLPLLLLVLIADKLLKRDTMGGGDIKLIFMIGLFFDWKLNLFHIILSCVFGLFFSLILVRARPGRPFPFAPAICAASFVNAMWGEAFVGWYIGLLL